jgi:hypothetical protein
VSVIEMKRPDCPWCTTPVNPGEDSQGREPVDINGRLFHAGCIADMQRTGYDSATLEEN